MSAASAVKPGVLIVGGGPAGSAAAILLARAGVTVTLFEREAKPVNKVCGEFLSEEAVDVLTHLGVHPTSFSSPSIRTLRVSKSRHRFERSLPFRAHSLSRRVMDEALLQQAEVAGATIARGHHVVGMEREASAWRVHLRNGESLCTPHVMLATGKHDIAGFPRPRGKQHDLIGFKQYFHLTPTQQEALHDSIELHLFPGGYAGLQLVEDGTANLCCTVRSGGLVPGPARWPSVLERMTSGSTLLCERLSGATPLQDKPLAIAPIPYGFVQRETQQGLWMLGDQAAVVPSFTGDGMSMALHSGVLAAGALLSGADSQAFQRGYAKAIRRQVVFATALSQRMVHSFDQRIAATLLCIAPNILQWIATQTRLPQATRQAAFEAVEHSLSPAASSSARYGKVLA